MRLFLILAAAALLTAPADAQRRHDHHHDRDAFGEAGAFALAFSVDWLRIGPFLGGVGGRYWLTDRTVLTGTLRAGISTTDRDPDGDQPQPDVDSDSYDIGLGVGVERHVGRSRRVSPFVALGLDATVRRLEDEQTYPDGGFAKNALRTTVLGGSLFVGAEYRFAPGLSLAGAHALGASYEWGEQSSRFVPPPDGGEPMDREEDLSILRVGTSTSMLTLSVYF